MLAVLEHAPLAVEEAEVARLMASLSPKLLLPHQVPVGAALEFAVLD